MEYVFISHKNCEPDLGITQRMYRYLCENKFNVFYDGNLGPGNWDQQLSQMIRGATTYIIVASERSLTTPECLTEVSMLREERNEKEKILIPFVIDDYFFHLRPGSSEDYLFGGNRDQAVVLSKFASEEEAFEKLKQYLLRVIDLAVNNRDDFEFDGFALKKYKGSDLFVEIPDFVEEIADNAFSGNAALTKVGIPASVRRIGRMAFMGCGNLLTVEGMENVCSCEQSAFDRTPIVQRGYTKLLNGVLFGGADHGEELVLPEGTRTVADRAFVCNRAKKIVFPDGLEYIGAYAFRDCFELVTVEFPRTLKGIAKGAFKGCFMLKKAVFHGKVPPQASEAFDHIEFEEAGS